MIGNYEYKHLRVYPQMSKSDTAIWNRFITKYPDKFDSIDYDIRVGPWSDLDPDLPPKIMFDGIWNSLWRVDAMGYKDTQTHIIELKPSAMAAAVGQVLCYKVLYELQFKNVSDLRMNIITDFIRPPLKTCAKQFGIKLYAV